MYWGCRVHRFVCVQVWTTPESPWAFNTRQEALYHEITYTKFKNGSTSQRRRNTCSCWIYTTPNKPCLKNPTTAVPRLLRNEPPILIPPPRLSHSSRTSPQTPTLRINTPYPRRRLLSSSSTSHVWTLPRSHSCTNPIT